MANIVFMEVPDNAKPPEAAAPGSRSGQRHRERRRVSGCTNARRYKKREERALPLGLYLHNGDAGFSFAEGAEAIGFYRRMGAQMSVDGGPQRTRALTVDDGDLAEPRHDRAVDETVHLEQRLIGGLAAQIELSLH